MDTSKESFSNTSNLPKNQGNTSFKFRVVEIKRNSRKPLRFADRVKEEFKTNPQLQQELMRMQPQAMLPSKWALLGMLMKPRKRDLVAMAVGYFFAYFVVTLFFHQYWDPFRNPTVSLILALSMFMMVMWAYGETVILENRTTIFSGHKTEEPFEVTFGLFGFIVTFAYLVYAFLISWNYIGG